MASRKHISLAYRNLHILYEAGVATQLEDYRTALNVEVNIGYLNSPVRP